MCWYIQKFWFTEDIYYTKFGYCPLNTIFQKMDLFPSSGLKGGNGPTLLSPLGTLQFYNWIVWKTSLIIESQMTWVFFHLKEVSNSGYKLLLCALARMFIFMYLFIYLFIYSSFLSFSHLVGHWSIMHTFWWEGSTLPHRIEQNYYTNRKQ
jgi:hypothetical protein